MPTTSITRTSCGRCWRTPEREIVLLIAKGLSNKEIGGRLTIAPYTVKNHVHNILEKLALHSRLQIAMYTRNDEAS